MLLHERLREAIGENFPVDKDFTAALCDRLETEDKKFGMKTLLPKVSKLLKGHGEGRDFFIDSTQPHRLTALAETSGLAAATLTALADQIVLVLEPGLGQPVVDFLRDRVDHGNEPFAVIAIAASADHLVAMRDEAKRHRRGHVVVRNHQDFAFFKGADVPASTVQQVPRGFVVGGLEELYRLPPPPLPALFDADGNVRVPVTDGMNLVALQRVHAYHRAIEQLNEGFSPTVALSDAVQWFGATVTGDTNTSCKVEYGEGPSVFDFPNPRNLSTYVWQHNGRVFATGPQAGRFGEFLAPHHAVVEPDWLVLLAEFAPLMADPWQARRVVGDPGHPVCRPLIDAVRSTGGWTFPVNYGRGNAADGPSHVLAWLGREMADAMAAAAGGEPYRCVYAPFAAAFAPTYGALADAAGPARLAEPEDLTAARERITALLARGAKPTHDSMVALRALSRALDCELLVLERGADELPHLQFDLGGGHLMEMRTAKLLGAPQPLEHIAGTALYWGGDIMAKLVFTEASVLEGPEPPCFARRRVEAARLAAAAAAADWADRNDDDD